MSVKDLLLLSDIVSSWSVNDKLKDHSVYFDNLFYRLKSDSSFRDEFTHKLGAMHALIGFVPTTNPSFQSASRHGERGAKTSSQNAFLAASGSDAADLVADEIRQEATMTWADRKKPENKGKPWTKGPVAFIRQWYGKWLEAGTLTRAHLRYDTPLYNAYAAYLGRCTKQDAMPELVLPTEIRVYLDDPVDALQRKRQQNAAWALRKRTLKIKSS